MFINITEAVSVATGIVAGAGVIGLIVYISENYSGWFEKPKKDPYALPYDVNSPLVKRFQYLAGITDKHGSMSYCRSRFNKIRYY